MRLVIALCLLNLPFILFGQNNLDSTYVIPADSSGTIYNWSELDIPSTPSGGDKGFKIYIQTNVKPVLDTLPEELQERIFVEFIIEVDGSITHVRIKKSYNNSKKLEDYAIQLIQDMPAWTPGQIKTSIDTEGLHGPMRRVRSMNIVPVSFIYTK